jgi:subtilisin-like proprotein convertase family protein
MLTFIIGSSVIPVTGAYTLTIRYKTSSAMTANMKVNGGTATTLSFPASYSSTDYSTKGLKVQVSLNAGSSNTIQFLGNGSNTAPDFDSIAIARTGTVTAGPGLNLAVTDNGYTGALTSPSMSCVNLVSTLSGTVGSVTATLGMTHTYVGDLTVKLKSPAGTTVTLMSRPGGTEASDNGADSPTGDSSNLSSSYPITFETRNSPSAENMGSTISDSQTVCQNDSTCTFAPDKGAAAAGTLLTFNGETAAGTWQLCVGDGRSSDTGTIDKVTLTIRN